MRLFCIPLALVLLPLSRPATASEIAPIDSPCYSAASSKTASHLAGNSDQLPAKYCEPPFENLAVNRRVVASSTCGNPPLRVCQQHRQRAPGSAKPSTLCELCDSNQPKRNYPSSHLTDYHVHSTCWISGPVSVNDPGGVNLTLSFGKKHTVYYVSLTDCGLGLPDSIEAFKSADFGANWQLWHLFSSNCSADFPEHRAGYSYQFGGSIGPREVVCSDTSQLHEAGYSDGILPDDRIQPQQRIVLSFSTNFKRASPLSSHDRDPVIADWMLATDIRLVLRRRRRRPLGSQWHGDADARRNFHNDDAFAFANIDIGGRCFCNGHAARCLPSSSPSSGMRTAPVCQCRHGTEGEDCERCKPFWVDLPWRRGTEGRPAQCRRCQCNGHTDRCHFDAGTYQLAAEPKSAGVCLGCRHNTAGRNCQYCRPGYHRNWLAAVESARVCTLCNCHPLGSASGICDRDTGRCVCKPGVGGEKCDRCLAGFEQTSDPMAPCKRPRDTPTDPWSASIQTKTSPVGSTEMTKTKTQDHENSKHKESDDNSGNRKQHTCPGKCRSNNKRLTRAQFRNIDWAVVFLVQHVSIQRRWVQVSGSVQLTIRCSTRIDSSVKNPIGLCRSSPGSAPMTEFYIRKRHWNCACPAQLRAGSAYLLLRRLPKRERRRQRLARRRRRRRRRQPVLLQRDIVWPWQPELQERLQRMEAAGRSRQRRQQRKRRGN